MANETILVVDDSLLIRKVVGQSLAKLGYQVLQASNGLEAVKMARSESPALILMDVNMPEINGLEALKQLQTDPATVAIPVVMLSGSEDPADREQAFAAGCRDMLPKPPDVDALMGLRRFLDSA